ncbi:MAG: sugar ABC transporter substrate-binding protein [Chloroflexi bacterium]|jgi:ABC-type glycerol-3-phosphate transport system substrate-binding protein|uniref:Sugar ABC transporter substrate-binding protein n=1 Tax=Candidatus Thermofonsia Clade 3 bacterium TaxID=2364212 RepID=A0A2M8QGM2_9CHLR|nr:sugar ABC transporter substrate-binding protein [Candidatus Roseilinea sp. NK_OTU-006]PJF48975.1 MAG: sugar ABC transporter substrate-binding protein [Candidatus Thermofonsia Clade 3 bacterium]RMG63441.1 MAG: sugar ABC transporter substrate-binding protein [Chloroflexota bacterium]
MKGHRFSFLLGAAALLAACAAPSAPAATTVPTRPSEAAAAPVTLSIIMEQVPDYDIVASLTRQFEAEHPNIKITFDAMPYDAMRDKILTSALAPSASYDVIIVDNPWMDEFARAGFLLPLDDYIARAPDYDFNDFVGPLRDIGVVDGKVYGVPYYNYALGLIVRQDLFDNPDYQAKFQQAFGKPLQVPTTLEDYVAVGKFFKSQGIFGAAMQPQRGYKIFEEWKNWLYAAGGNLLDAAGNVIIDNAAAQQALEMYIDMYKNAAPPNSVNWGFDEALRSMSSGESATMLSYNWMLPTLNKSDGPAGELAGKFALHEVPGGKAVLGAWHWAIPKNTASADAAWTYIAWITSKAIDKQRVIAGGAPTRVSVMQDREVWEKGFGQQYYETVLKILEDAEPLARGARAEEIINEVGTELNSAVAGEKDVAAALAAAAQKTRAILARP